MQRCYCCGRGGDFERIRRSFLIHVNGDVCRHRHRITVHSHNIFPGTWIAVHSSGGVAEETIVLRIRLRLAIVYTCM